MRVTVAQSLKTEQAPFTPGAKEVTPIDTLVRTAAQAARAEPGDAGEHAFEAYVAAFDAIGAGPPDGVLNIFTFHLDIPPAHQKISYVDVEHDHGEFDYPHLARHFAASARFADAGCRLIYVTDLHTQPPEFGMPVSIVRLPMNPAHTMYERVKAMAAYVSSQAFSKNTAFLDTDAFPNRSLACLFDRQFDVGVTVRDTEGFYMPLNEAVIFASVRSPEKVRSFFRSYLATYDELIEHPAIVAYYGDVKRWRGGQLSLNAVVAARGLLNYRTQTLFDGVKIEILPCDLYNYWVEPMAPMDEVPWEEKYILHLKGDTKHRATEFILRHKTYQAGVLGGTTSSI